MASESNGAVDPGVASEQLETSLARVPERSSPYGPESYHPLMIRNEDAAGKGSFYDWVGMIRTMVDREVKTLGQYVQSGWYKSDWRRKSLVTKYYKLAQWQITSEAGQLNYRRIALLDERTAIHAILTASELPLERSAAKHPQRRRRRRDDPDLLETVFSFDQSEYEGILMVPLTAKVAYSRVEWITQEIRRLTAIINDAIRRRHYFDCGPLIEYFKTPADKRGNIDLKPLQKERRYGHPVSYTHLTLPTICSV